MRRLPAENSEEVIRAATTLNGRSCGSCSLCCRLLDVPEVGKPVHDWCHHCRPGHGCLIYDQRPNICRGYGCLWLLDAHKEFNDDWFPRKAKIVADWHYYEKSEDVFIRFHVDPHFPNRWREEPYHSRIKEIALRGLRGELLDGRQVRVIISILGKWTTILPHREVETGPGVILRTGENNFEFIACKSDEDVKELGAKLDLLDTVLRKARMDNPDLAASNPLALLDIAAKDPRLMEAMREAGRKRATRPSAG